ncbi:hypothetical protein GUJ93_ZPchr0011g28260 [Zizania palustris]|uniref:Uncharacterized protein n=1 Tax=Zizania palustris TaxID=103762 RepID=A0A8J5WL87_ZIZPA|nr:hypothetical protein GUJ93_ZPchr0011g28260 [Zizania palustris]
MAANTAVEALPDRGLLRASHSASVSMSWSLRHSPLARVRHRECSSNAFSLPSASSNGILSTSQNCSIPATAGYKRSGIVSRSFLTMAASRVTPSPVYLAAVPLILPA